MSELMKEVVKNVIRIAGMKKQYELTGGDLNSPFGRVMTQLLDKAIEVVSNDNILELLKLHRALESFQGVI